MKRIICISLLLVFVICIFGCSNNKEYNVSFNANYDVIESRHAIYCTLDEYGENDHNISLIKNNIFKNINNLETAFDEFNLEWNNDELKNKYNEDYFKEKALVIYQSVDSQGGYTYKFKKMEVIENELYINIHSYMPSGSNGTTALTYRLFFIEIDQNDVANYDKINYKHE